MFCLVRNDTTLQPVFSYVRITSRLAVLLVGTVALAIYLVPRLLVAQARDENFTLVTRDARCQRYDVAVLSV